MFDAWQREHGGNIVNISAPFELKGVALQAHVAAAKAGVDSLTRTCAVECGTLRHPRQRRCARRHRGHRGGAALLGRGRPKPGPGSPLGIDGHGSDIAHAVLFFCSPAARFISGQVIAVDGAATVDQLKLGLGRV